jgi:hypothetical protein
VSSITVRITQRIDEIMDSASLMVYNSTIRCTTLLFSLLTGVGGKFNQKHTVVIDGLKEQQCLVTQQQDLRT